jgi:ankyrin repeat protein
MTVIFFENRSMKIWLFCLLLFSSVTQAEDFKDLFHAALAGNSARLESLLRQGLDVNGATPSGRTALMAASYNGNLRIVKLLLNYGADVNLKDKNGNTALMDAVRFTDAQLVKTLIAAGADVNAVDSQGLTILARAKHITPPAIIKLLEDAGAKEVLEPEKTDEEAAADGEADKATHNKEDKNDD